jgi:hypothetical protein
MFGEILMSDSTETKKNPTRGAAMAKVWAARREFAANPVCCCGCGAKLAVGKDPEHQRLFCQGHDGRLHKLLRQVLRGEASRQDIPAAARANLARIGFVQKDREILNAFANPGQQANRRRKLQP